MVRSKRKWKKDSPEKLTQRIENEIKLSKSKPPKEISPDEKSPETKKSKGTDELPSDFSSGTALDSSLIIKDTQIPIGELTLTEDNPEDQIVEIHDKVNDSSEKMEGEIPEKPKADIKEKEKPPIEETLNVITQSLSTLTKTIAAMSANMVNKTDIAILQNEMTSQNKQIAENAEQIKSKMSLEEGKTMAKKIKDHDLMLENTSTAIERQESVSKTITAELKQHKERESNTSNRIDGLAEALKKKNDETQKELEDIKRRLSEQNSEILLLKNGQRVLTVPLPDKSRIPETDFTSQNYTPNPRMNVIIEGLNETEDENLICKIEELCTKMGEKIDPRDIATAWRLKRKVPIKNNPNPVKICFANYHTKNRIMNAKYKLQHSPSTAKIWINHDETAVIRRAKGRARFIASYSRKKGSQVQITPSGIVLDNVFYSYENLDKIPSIYIPPTSLCLPPAHEPKAPGQAIEPMEQPIKTPTDRPGAPINMLHTPQQGTPIEPIHGSTSPTPGNNAKRNSPKTPRVQRIQKMKLTASGLVYSGPTAIFSHLYKCTFTIDNTPYHSVEQKIQYEKAMMAEDLQAAELIMNTQDTWTIKNIGNRVKVTKEYLENRLHIARIGNVAKFRDNPDLMEALIETGDLNLIEGTQSSFWGGGEPYESDAYDNEDVHGKNHQGYMLVDLRTNERKRRAGIIP